MDWGSVDGIVYFYFFFSGIIQPFVSAFIPSTLAVTTLYTT